MKSRSFRLCLSALAALVLSTSLALAQCGSGSGCGSSSPQAAKVQTAEDKVVLAAWQQKKMDAIDKEQQAKVAAARPKFDQARKDMMKLMADPKTSDAAITKKVKEAMGYQAQIVAANMIAQRKKDRILTPEQKTKLAASQGGCGCGGGSAKPASSGGGCGSVKPASSSGGCGSGGGGCGG